MPIYCFRDESGDIHEIYFGMQEAPPFGGVIEHEGRRLTRIVEAPSIKVEPDIRLTTQQFGSWEGYDRKGNDLAPRRDAEGCPQFESVKECKEFATKWNQENPSSTVTWDPD